MELIYSKIANIVTNLTWRQKFCILILVDLTLIPLAVMMSVLLSGLPLQILTSDLLPHILLMTFAGLLASLGLGLPRLKLNSYEQSGMQKTAAYGVIVGLAGGLLLNFVPVPVISGSFMVIAGMMLIIMSVSARLTMRNLLLFFYQRGQDRHRVLIYGAGQTGVQLAMALHTDDAVEPVAFIDDNKTLQKVYVAGLPVYPPVRIQKIISDLNVDRVVLAMPSISRPKQARLARHLETLGCDVATLPSFASLVGEGSLTDQIQLVKPSDYLGRTGLDQELSGGCGIYHDSCVMVTGAGGSIGSELARQVLVCAPKKLVLFDVSEYALYQIERELAENLPPSIECDIVAILGTVTDETKITQVMVEHGVDTVLHAAAYKHVTMVERNRLVGLYNNVFGTRSVVRAAREAGAKHFILVSTDKAVRPENVMGASKRLAELVVQDAASRSTTTRYGIVRFGNVLGSSGSVVPLFEEQIARGGPVTLTHSEVTRYFMTIAEAARLVLLVGSQEQLQSEQGQVYVLDMGAPVPIKQLARQMIEHRGYTVCDQDNPTGDIEIVITGLRPGEKLHEELAMRGSEVRPTAHPKIKQVEETSLSELETATAIRSLADAIDTNNEKAAIDVLNRWVRPSCHVHFPDAIGLDERGLKEQ